jgi:tetratricopeptide (TPR) repeat protein
MNRVERAAQLHDEGIALADQGKSELAIQKYLEAIGLDPQRAATYYNIGLIYKYQSRWRKSFEYNRSAVERAPDDEAGNLAIAATALRDWATARSVWRRLGMPIGAGDQPIEEDFGATPVRLNAHDAAEVVWARRIDPVRARLLNIPFASSGYRYGDIVLHDGAPVGSRLDAQGRERPVFNVLQLFQASRFSTFEVDLTAPSPEDVEALEALCDELDFPMEDWSSSVRFLCKACSEGTPHEHGDPGPAEWNPSRRIALAASDEALIDRALHRWLTGKREIGSVALAVDASMKPS